MRGLDLFPCMHCAATKPVKVQIIGRVYEKYKRLQRIQNQHLVVSETEIARGPPIINENHQFLKQKHKDATSKLKLKCVSIHPRSRHTRNGAHAKMSGQA